MGKNVGVIICAAGSGERFGGKRKKQFADVGGRAAFLRSVEFFADRSDVKQVLLAIPEDEQELVEIKWKDNLSFYGVKIYIGAAERFETVQKGIALLKDDIELVAIHDAVRCCLTKKWIDECFEKAAETKAAMLAAPVVATIKQAVNKTIEKTIDRTNLYEAQTPQVFEIELLKKAYANLDNLDKSAISDDAQLVEALGEKVAIIETDQSNLKITRPSDIAMAEAIIKSRPKPRQTGYVGPYSEAQW